MANHINVDFVAEAITPMIKPVGMHTADEAAIGVKSFVGIGGFIARFNKQIRWGLREMKDKTRAAIELGILVNRCPTIIMMTCHINHRIFGIKRREIAVAKIRRENT